MFIFSFASSAGAKGGGRDRETRERVRAGGSVRWEERDSVNGGEKQKGQKQAAAAQLSIQQRERRKAVATGIASSQRGGPLTQRRWARHRGAWG